MRINPAPRDGTVTRQHPGFLFALVLVAGCNIGGTSDPQSVSASITDPAGDGGMADIVSATIDIAGSDITVQVIFTAESFQADSMLVQFNLDTDESAATGYTTANPGHVGFGIDCMIELGKYSATTRAARISRWQGNTFVPAANATLRVITNGFEATVPASACDDDGPALLKVDAFRQLSATTYSTRQDWAPDAGQPAVPLR